MVLHSLCSTLIVLYARCPVWYTWRFEHGTLTSAHGAAKPSLIVLYAWCPVWYTWYFECTQWIVQTLLFLYPVWFTRCILVWIVPGTAHLVHQGVYQRWKNVQILRIYLCFFSGCANFLAVYAQTN